MFYFNINVQMFLIFPDRVVRYSSCGLVGGILFFPVAYSAAIFFFFGFQELLYCDLLLSHPRDFKPTRSQRRGLYLVRYYLQRRYLKKLFD